MAWGTICGWSETGYWGEMGVGNLMVLWIYIYKTINKAEPAHSREFTTSDPSRGWMETLWVVYIMITISHAQCCLEPRVGKRKEKKRKLLHDYKVWAAYAWLFKATTFTSIFRQYRNFHIFLSCFEKLVARHSLHCMPCNASSHVNYWDLIWVLLIRHQLHHHIINY